MLLREMLEMHKSRDIKNITPNGRMKRGRLELIYKGMHTNHWTQYSEGISNSGDVETYYFEDIDGNKAGWTAPYSGSSEGSKLRKLEINEQITISAGLKGLYGKEEEVYRLKHLRLLKS